MKRRIIVILMAVFLIFCQLKPVISISTIQNEEAMLQEEDNSVNFQDELESTEYIIDNTDNIIYRIPPQTNIEIFKRNFNSTNIKVFRDKNETEEITSGTIGTGMFLKDMNTNKVYEISVIGDLDANGQIARVELTKVIRCVVGLRDYQFTGVYFRSSDINNDNKIDHIDITLLIRYNVFGELEIDENKEVQSPVIDVVSGTAGENEWYTSNVEIKVLQSNESNIAKTTYRILGTKEVKETVITSDEKIALEQGTYTILANSYTKSGYKSLTTKKIIKIDTTAPTAGTLNMLVEGEDSTIYENDTWINKNVVISCQDGEDNESGHSSTSYYVEGVDEIPEGTQTPKTISESGVYKAVVTTKDLAGNSSTREYTIRIDKNMTLNPQIDVVKGSRHDESDWYYDDVELKVTTQNSEENYSKVVRNTYKIDGTKTVEETTIGENEKIIINTNGTFTITAYSYNEAGGKSSGTSITIKRDDTIPNAPSVQVTSGTKDENNKWYKNDVTLQVTPPEIQEPLSQITKVTYSIELQTESSVFGTKGTISQGAEKLTPDAEEIDITQSKTISIQQDGIFIIKVYNYNEAGTRSKEKKIIIRKDSTAPSKAEIEAQNVTYDSFKLVCKAEDATSGIVSYEIYLDGKLKNTITSTKNQVEYSLTDQTTADHTVYVIAKDEAGNALKSEEKVIHMGKVELGEIEHVEFVVTSFKITGEDEGQSLTEGVKAILSTTSVSTSPKYIMMNTSSNVTGYIEGKLRLVTTKGIQIDELQYFPDDFTINVTYYENGSGSNFQHEKSATFFGTALSGEAGKESEQKSINVAYGVVPENKFSMSDKKIAGTQTHIRVTIQSVKLGENDIPFTLVQE